MKQKPFIEYEKMSKKKQREFDKQNRVVTGFNTGTQVHKDAKHPSRGKRKNSLKKELDKYTSI